MVGAVTGLIAGITGVGAGVFLAAAMMSLKWASMRRVAAVAQASNFFTALPGAGRAVWIEARCSPRCRRNCRYGRWRPGSAG